MIHTRNHYQKVMKIVLVKVDRVKTLTCRNQNNIQCSPCLPTFSGPRSSSPQLLTKAVFRSTMKVKCWYWASTIYTNYSLPSSQFLGECKEFYLKFMICLAENDNLTSACREDSKAYLGCRWVFRICLFTNLMISWLLCRMEKKLMAKEDWSKLGFSDLERKESQTKQS